MTTQQNDDNQNGQQGNEGNPPAPNNDPTLEEVTADRDRWKAISRQNEANYNSTRTELQQFKDAQQSAIEAAKSEGRTSALGEVSTELVTAELRLQAVSAGAELPSLEFLDLNRFTGDDSRPNSDAVKSFIDSLPKQNSGSGFPHLEGAGHNKGGNGDFASTDPTELADFIAGGSFL
ncbi:hypothetical protein GPA10_22295 [Streptomyces sp. p1417]|uniref:Scaffolding protein n=1 Tax=Streptomyces typhae TaxID=2681492 RepID=A0A6L6X118_9ACTN|nr:hypothetical protein [Streptomyces typhae]MVO87416.1 hypothetical protein [Streptomyces typhae]